MHFKYFNINEIQNFIHQNNLAIFKKYGQNFLINAGVVDTIIKNAKITKDDLVIEIGCGLGSLTHKIIETESAVYGFEIDKAYINHLKSFFADYKNFNLIEGDFLDNIKTFIKNINIKNYSRFIILGNLPYHITTPILEKIFITPIQFDSMIFMVQKEVAERITAIHGTKEYGRLSIFCQYYSAPKIIASISPKSFYPSPKVDSALVHFEKRTNNIINVTDIKIFFKLVNSIFVGRRKQIINNLLISPFINNLNKDIILRSLEKAGIPSTSRGEDLPMQKLADLSNAIFEEIKNIPH